MEDSSAKTAGFDWLQWVVVACIAYAVVLFSLAPGRNSGPPANRTISKNNLKNVVLGAYNWQEVYGGAAPPGWTFGPQRQPLHGWTMYLLPFIDEQPLYNRTDLTEPWDAPVNREVAQTPLRLLRQPTLQHPEVQYPWADYAGNSHVLAVRPADKWKGEPAGPDGRRFGASDGESTTIAFGEITTARQPWAMPGNLRDPSVSIGRPSGFAGPWRTGGRRSGCNFAFCDGTVRFIDSSVNVLRALATPRGGDKPGDDW